MSWVRPSTLAEALAARAEHPGWTVLAGGTDLLVGALERPDPPGVIDLFGLPELVGIERRADGAVAIGAGTTYAALLASDVVRKELPALAASAREVGAVQIQERGTLGGNMITSSPVGDTLPVLLALDAEVELRSASMGTRRLAYQRFITGYRKTALAKDELLVRVVFPAGCGALRQHWRKVGTRRAQAISKVMLAAAARLEQGKIAHARIALGAVADRPIRVPTAEEQLVGREPSASLADGVAETVGNEIHPIDDVRSSAAYRRQVAQNLVRRFVLELARGPA